MSLDKIHTTKLLNVQTANSPVSLNSTDMNKELDSQCFSIDKKHTEASVQNRPTVDSGSACCHPRLVNSKTVQPPTFPRTFNNHLYALIIGIDNYQNEKIPKLRGCVNDSENICRFLTESLRANPAHIKHLRDTQAKRQDILSAFEEHLINNREIQQNDAIVFYFAGHGSYEIPEVKYPTGSQIETICPYDDRMGARGIPDRTIASLIHRLAVLKGNNITAIFDSCHSGGMGRISDSDLENARYLPPPDSRYPTAGLDDDIRDADTSLPTEIDDIYTPCPPLRSHVLLAACQHDEVAYETSLSSADRHAGAFTTLLLNVLRQPGRALTETTYIGLLHTLQQPENKSWLPKQTPYVEGDHKTRILFSLADPGRYFSVLLHDDGAFSVAMGTIHGVDYGTEFTITSDKERLQNLKPFKVLRLMCVFKKPDNIILRDDARAEITKWNQLHPKVFFQQASDDLSDSQDYDIVVSRSRDGRMQLDRRDGLIPCYADKIIPFTSQDAHADLTKPNAQASAIIDAITRFNFHLLCESRSNIVGEKLRVKLEYLSPLAAERYGPSTTISYFPADNAKDFFMSGEKLIQQANIKKGPKVSAAVKLTDMSKYYSFTLSVHDVGRSLFPYVLGFDPSTYEIAIYYHPEEIQEGPLRDGRAVTIGYGPEGGDPIQFYPNEVTFFKIFVTSKYVDLNALVQASAFAKGVMDRASRQLHTISDGFWESWVYIVRT